MSLIKNLFCRLNPKLQIDISSWELPDTGITVLQGASGSGKSTIIKILLGLVDCKNLSWTLNGVNVAKLPIEKKNLSVVFQDYALFSHLTVRQNFEFAATARKIKKPEQQIQQLCQQLNLEESFNKKIDILSGGEKQRVALARSLIGHPQFLFLDEPFSAIDENLKRAARAFVKKMVVSKKIPCLLVTHDDRDRESLGDKTFYLKNGKIYNK